MAARKAAVAAAGVLAVLYGIHRWRSNARLDPKGRIVVVTGCDTGFGRMLAERLAALGATVVAGCYTEKGRQELQAAIPTGVVLPLDVTNQASVDAFAAETLRRFPEIWGLVNNAGININSVIELSRVDDFTRTFDVNVFGVVRVTKAFLGAVRRARGRIVNVASLAGTVALPGQAAYAASKHAIVGFTDALRREMYPFGVGVVSIEPVMMNTPIVTDWLAGHAVRRDWQEASDDVKRAYGPTFLEDFLEATKRFVTQDVQDPQKVVATMEVALFAAAPAVRYRVGAPLSMQLAPNLARTRVGDWLLRGLFPMPVTAKL